MALVLVTAPCAALAQSDKDLKLCEAEDADDVAVSACTRLIETSEVGPGDLAIVYYHRGAAYWRKRDFDRAIADENKATEIDPGYANAYMRRGASYGSKGDFDLAVADATKAIEIDPENVKAYSNRGIARGRKGDVAGAIADATKAIEINPKFAGGYIVRGEYYAIKGDHGRLSPISARRPKLIRRTASTTSGYAELRSRAKVILTMLSLRSAAGLK
jgi:tetratricopeptide (TPR) repeat protein